MTSKRNRHDLLHPPPGEAIHTVTNVGGGRVELNVSTQFDGDNAVTVIGLDLSRGGAFFLAARLTREAVRR